MLAKPQTMPVHALATLIEMENFGELHNTIRPPVSWFPKMQRDEINAKVRAEFAREGLIDGKDRIDDEFADSLKVLCRAGAEFYGWINDGKATKGVLAAAIGREAVLAIRDGASVTLSQIRPESLPEALVAQLPELRPGRGEAMSVLQSELSAASPDGRVSTEAGVGSRPAPAAVRVIAQIADLPTTGTGELYVAVRDRMGRRRVSEPPLRYSDTSNGRWLGHAVPTGDDAQVFVAPATPGRLVSRLQEMHRALTS